MRHLEIRDSDHSIRLVEGPDPSPGPDEVLVRVAASGVNRADLLQIAGKYPPPPGEPAIPGLEASGEIAATGEKVCALLAGGGHGELVAAPVGQLFPAPRASTLVDAAGIPEAWLTAFVNVVVEAELPREGALLVHAGASGVGLAAIALGRYRGARVAATTRSARKLDELRRAGAELAIDTSAEDFVSAVEGRWGKNAVDVVLDPVGASTFAGDVRLLATGGRIVFIASLSGPKAELDIPSLLARRAKVVGSTLRSRSRAEKAAIVRRFVAEVLPGFETGALAPSTDSVFAPADASRAFDRMRGNENVGKILIDWRAGGSASHA